MASIGLVVIYLVMMARVPSGLTLSISLGIGPQICMPVRLGSRHVWSDLTADFHHPTLLWNGVGELEGLTG